MEGAGRGVGWLLLLAAAIFLLIVFVIPIGNEVGERLPPDSDGVKVQVDNVDEIVDGVVDGIATRIPTTQGPQVPDNAEQTVNGLERRASSKDGRMYFKKGEAVWGYRVVRNDGKVICDGGNCYCPVVDYDGYCEDCAVNPWTTEVPEELRT